MRDYPPKDYVEAAVFMARSNREMGHPLKRRHPRSQWPKTNDARREAAVPFGSIISHRCRWRARCFVPYAMNALVSLFQLALPKPGPYPDCGAHF